MTITYKSEYSEFIINPSRINFIQAFAQENIINVYFSKDDYLRLTFNSDTQYRDFLAKLQSSM